MAAAWVLSGRGQAGEIADGSPVQGDRVEKPCDPLGASTEARMRTIDA